METGWKSQQRGIPGLVRTEVALRGDCCMRGARPYPAMLIDPEMASLRSPRQAPAMSWRGAG